MSFKSINNMKSRLAQTYTATYSTILQRIAESENWFTPTRQRVKIETLKSCVWVFTNMEDVAYVYSETREATAVARGSP